MKVAVIGGTGEMGFALSTRLAVAGHNVIIGSREKEKAQKAAELASSRSGRAVSGCENAVAASQGDLVVAAIPADSQEQILPAIGQSVKGKIVIDISVQLSGVPGEKSCAGVRAKQLLPEARVVAAFQTIPSAGFLSPDPQPYDVLVFGDDQDAKAAAAGLIATLGFRGIDCGGLADAWISESLTKMLIRLNKKYKKRSIGIRLAGI